MPKRTLIIFLLTSVLLSACVVFTTTTPVQRSEIDEALASQALTDYFHFLSSGEYQLAAPLYAGPYDWLINNNPDVPPTDYAALLEHGCLYNGLQCLDAGEVVTVQSQSEDTFLFRVEFRLANGSLFVLGPCCGATETEQPPVSQFEYQVVRIPGEGFRVSDLPPYVP